MKHIWPALKIFLILTVVTGIVYPLLVTGIARLIFPSQAEGSLITLSGKIIGSELIGQKFSDPKYFWGRPSATDYNPVPSSGSNLGPTSAVLKERIDLLRDSLAAVNGKPASEVPPDLLFASGSGLDPHLSPQAAFFQLDRVAKARHLDDAAIQKLRALVTSRLEKPSLNFLGDPRVNVLKLNLAVDSTFGEVKP